MMRTARAALLTAMLILTCLVNPVSGDAYGALARLSVPTAKAIIGAVKSSETVHPHVLEELERDTLVVTGEGSDVRVDTIRNGFPIPQAPSPRRTISGYYAVALYLSSVRFFAERGTLNGLQSVSIVNETDDEPPRAVIVGYHVPEAAAPVTSGYVVLRCSEDFTYVVFMKSLKVNIGKRVC